MSTLLIIGLGYSAKAVARRLKEHEILATSPLPLGEVGTECRERGFEEGGEHPVPSPQPSPHGRGRDRWRIIGTSRSTEGVAEIEALGYEAVRFTGDAPSADLARTIGEASHLLISAAPGEQSDPLLLHHRADLEAARGLEWIGYLSTIGVYGDHQGAWIDETATPRPKSQRSQWRLAAERDWQDFAARHGAPLQIFRLAGIYGPGRNPLERLHAGQERTIYKPGQVFNRIHVEDIATSVVAGIEAGARATGIFNVTDDEPAAPQDVAAFCAKLLGVEPPPVVTFEEADLTPMARSFYGETKRVRNGRIKRELGVELKFPTFREGLEAIAGDL